MILIVLLICTVYVLFLSAKYFLLDDYYDEIMYHSGGTLEPAAITFEEPSVYASLPTIEKEKNILNEFATTETSYERDMRALMGYIDKIKYHIKDHNNPIKLYLNILDSIKLPGKVIAKHTELVNIIKNMKFNTELDTYQLCKWLIDNFKEIAVGYIRFGQAYTGLSSLYKFMYKKYPDLPVNKSDYDNALIKPVQRLPRYPLLLRELARIGEKGESDEKISKVVSYTVKYLEYCVGDFNEKLKAAEIPKITDTNSYNLHKLYTRNKLPHPYDIIMFNILTSIEFPDAIMKHNTMKSPLQVHAIFRCSFIKSDKPVDGFIIICNNVIICVEVVNNTYVFKNKYAIGIKNTKITKESRFRLTNTDALLFGDIDIDFDFYQTANEFYELLQKVNREAR